MSLYTGAVRDRAHGSRPSSTVGSKPKTPSRAWWKESVVYQIYPASFMSSGTGNTPGWGDIGGIIARLDYLKDLGVDVVWVSPFFRSPQVDYGYDISDYKDIDPRYGTLRDVDDLIQGLKDRQMKLMIDLVVNHTSDQHPWFQESRSSKTNPKRDWYHWQPAKYDAQGNRQPPNNWSMQLGAAHSAWAWDEETQEYYLAIYTPQQPDLNWENPEVRAAVHDVLRFWLDRGACGFRMDVIDHISKAPGYPDAEVIDPNNKYQPGWKHYANGPRLHEYLKEIHHEVLSKYDCMTVGEMPFAKDVDEIMTIIGEDREELNMIFIFEIVNIDDVPNEARFSVRAFENKDLRHIVSKWQKALPERGGWNSLFLENHDQVRSVSRFCDDSTEENRALGAKLLALMQTTLSGTLYIYQGEELGMINFPLSWPVDEYKDIETINYWNMINERYPNDEQKLLEARRNMQRKARDHARTPMQWTGGVNAGFCPANVTPWMRVNEDYRIVNADAQRPKHNHQHHADPKSDGVTEAFKEVGKAVLRSFGAYGASMTPVRYTHGSRNVNDDFTVWVWWQRAILTRKEHKDVFVYGSYELLDDAHPTVFAYRRASAQQAFVIVLNFSGEETTWNVPHAAKVSRWIVSNYPEDQDRTLSGKIKLRPWEALMASARV